MTQHTPEPWFTDGRWIQALDQDFADTLAEILHDDVSPRRAQADAVHIVACVNACAGINPQAVPLILDALQAAVTEAEAEHARSVRAADVHNNTDGVGQKFDYMSPAALPSWVPLARTAIAKAQEG